MFLQFASRYNNCLKSAGKPNFHQYLSIFSFLIFVILMSTEWGSSGTCLSRAFFVFYKNQMTRTSWSKVFDVSFFCFLTQIYFKNILLEKLEKLLIFLKNSQIHDQQMIIVEKSACARARVSYYAINWDDLSIICLWW